MGALYGLIALGFVMIWNTAAVVNFAQGELAMLAMFFAYTAHVTMGLNIWLAIVLGHFTRATLSEKF